MSSIIWQKLSEIILSTFVIYKASVDYFLDFFSLYVFHLVTVDCVSEKWSVIVKYPMVPPSFSTNVYLNVLMPIAATSAICVV